MNDTLSYIILACAPLLAGWLLDLLVGDPASLPHPVVLFGKMTAWCERHFNTGCHRLLSGGIVAVGLVALVFAATWLLTEVLVPSPILRAILIFYCLAGTTLIREVRDVFTALDRSLGEGRQQVARIVGRDTSALSADEVRTAALETLAENLSDGVVAPLFWYMLLGVPGMMTYKMVNTLDSMIGYRTERYLLFGRVAARIDDAANYIPARLTALLMIVAAGCHGSHLRFTLRYGRCHASPNSGWPEAALAAILDCRFGGPHLYFGKLFDKPFIGCNERSLDTSDMLKAVRINRRAEVIMVLLVTALTAIVCTITQG
ncbi:MAG: adenosylcobinamide-phosphate synthase CbiB [Prevotella sp.]